MKRFMVAVMVCIGVLAVGISYTQEEQMPQMPVRVQAALERMVGTWSVEGDPDEDGISLRGKTVVQWTPGKQYLIINSQYQIGNINSYDNGIMGWDGLSENGIVIFRMAPVGIYEKYNFKAVSDTVSEGAFKGAGMGKKQTGKVRMVQQSPDKAIWTFTEQTSGGESKPGWKVVYTRVKKK